ncbi:MAG TPA: hypothetical protein V6C72_04255 [Chroococcales cyanobacterium]
MASSAGLSFDSLDQFTEENLDASNDWVMYVDSSTLPQYLNYSGSALTPLIAVRARCRITPELGKPLSGSSPQLYEELWYHDGLAVGMRRFSNLPMIKHRLGTIMVNCTSNQRQEALALSNALLHLTVDLELLAADRSFVVVPSAIYDTVEENLKRYKFFRRNDIGADRRRVIIHLVSNPPAESMDNYLVREDSE